MELTVMRGPLDITFTGAKVGMNWLLVVERANPAIPIHDQKSGETHYIRPGMVCVKLQGRRISEIKPNIADAAKYAQIVLCRPDCVLGKRLFKRMRARGTNRWVNGFFGRTSGPLKIKFETELDGTPRIAAAGSHSSPSAAKAKGRRGSILGSMGGDSALHAAASANGQQVYEVKCGGKNMAVTIGSIGVQLLVAQKRGAPSSTTLQYERMLNVRTLETDDGYVHKTAAVEIAMNDGQKTTMETPVAQEICLEVLIKLDQIQSAKTKEMASSNLRALSELSSDESSEEEDSSVEESSSDDDSDGSNDSDDGDDDGDGGIGTGLQAKPRLKSALKTSSLDSKSPKGLPGRTLSFDRTVSYDDGSYDGPRRQEPELEPEPEPEPDTAEAETVAALRALLAAEQKKLKRAESARQEMYKELQKREDSVAVQRQLAQENERLLQQLEAAEKAAALDRITDLKPQRRPGWEERVTRLRERLSISAAVDDDDVLDAAVDELERRLASALEAKQSAESALASVSVAAAEKVAAAERWAAEEKAAAAKKVADAETSAIEKKAAAKRDAAKKKKKQSTSCPPPESVPPTAADQAANNPSQPLTLVELRLLITQAKQIGQDANPQEALAAYDRAVRAALGFLKDHPGERGALKPELAELVSRTKQIKAQMAK